MGPVDTSSTLRRLVVDTDEVVWDVGRFCVVVVVAAVMMTMVMMKISKKEELVDGDVCIRHIHTEGNMHIERYMSVDVVTCGCCCSGGGSTT